MNTATEIISYIKIHPLYIEIEYLLSQIRNLHSIHSSTDDESIKWSKNIINIFGSAEILLSYNSITNCLFKLSLYDESRVPTYDSNYITLPFQFYFYHHITSTPYIKFNLYEVYHHINIDSNLSSKFSGKSLDSFYFSEKNTELVLQESVRLLKNIISITEKTKIRTELINYLKLFPINI